MYNPHSCFHCKDVIADGNNCVAEYATSDARLMYACYLFLLVKHSFELPIRGGGWKINVRWATQKMNGFVLGFLSKNLTDYYFINLAEKHQGIKL